MGGEHPSVLIDTHNICQCLLKQKKDDECEVKIRKILAAQTKMLGFEHPDSLYSQVALAGLLAAQNRYSESIKIGRDVSEKLSRVLGPNNVGKLRLDLLLSNVLLRQKQYPQAESLGAKTMAVLAKSEPSELYIMSMIRLGRTHLAQGHVDEGRSMFETAANEAVICLDKEDPLIGNAASEWTALVQDIGRMDSVGLAFKCGHKSLLLW